MKFKLTLIEWSLAASLSLLFSFAFLLLFPLPICVNRVSPLVELSSLQKQATEASARGHPFSVADVQEAIDKQSRSFEKIGYKWIVAGTGQNWTLVVSKKVRRSRLDALLFSPDPTEIVMCSLNAHDPHAIIVDGTGATRLIDLTSF